MGASRILWAIILLLISLAFGESPLGPVLIGIVEGGTGIEFRRELGHEIGQTARERVDAFIAQQQAGTHAVFANPQAGYGPYCGLNPNGVVRCCTDHSKRLTIGYQGPLSPYVYGGVRFSEYCY